MIIAKTPFRVSFFGGGTDYPEYFEKFGGAVLGTAIHNYAYVACSQFYSKMFEYNLRIAYSQVECVGHLDEIKHAPFRECLRWAGIERDVEVNYMAELPSFSGLGTSSTFVVGLLNALQAFQGRSMRGLDLAYQAINMERDILKDPVGCQDQTFAAVGGFNVIEFRTTRDITVHRVPFSQSRMEEFQGHLIAFFTGIRRRAGEVAAKQIKKVNANQQRLSRMRAMVDDGYNIITGVGGLERFGQLLHEGWCLKRELDDGVANDTIHQLYEAGMSAGAWGGKLLGAGGGGYFLFFAPPERHAEIRKRLSHLVELPIRINAPGSHIIHS